VKTRLALGFSLVLFLWGCNRGMETKEAIRQGVIDHLSSRKEFNMSLMQIDVLSVDFRGNEADATVAFRPKGGGEGMQLPYKFERKGNRWVVKGRSETGSGNPHGTMGMPDNPPPGAALPSGHPPIPKNAPPEQKK
jgi:hypothetical protein